MTNTDVTNSDGLPPCTVKRPQHNEEAQRLYDAFLKDRASIACQKAHKDLMDRKPIKTPEEYVAIVDKEWEEVMAVFTDEKVSEDEKE